MSEPPQNLEAEEYVLGAMILSPQAIEAVRPMLQAGDFYRGSHGAIYLAALALYARGEAAARLKLDELLENVHRILGKPPQAVTGDADNSPSIVIEEVALRVASNGDGASA